MGDLASVCGTGEVAWAGVERDLACVLVGEGGDLLFTQRHQTPSGAVAAVLP